MVNCHNSQNFITFHWLVVRRLFRVSFRKFLFEVLEEGEATVQCEARGVSDRSNIAVRRGPCTFVPIVSVLLRQKPSHGPIPCPRSPTKRLKDSYFQKFILSRNRRADLIRKAEVEESAVKLRQLYANPLNPNGHYMYHPL
jgi:hypothetical protein